jgi:hypothetical protein
VGFVLILLGVSLVKRASQLGARVYCFWCIRTVHIYKARSLNKGIFVFFLRLQKLHDPKSEVLQKMYLMYYMGEDGRRVYTFKVRNEEQYVYYIRANSVFVHGYDTY